MFYVCDRCGANLDPGEKCDCEDKFYQSIEYFKQITIVGNNGQIKFKEMQNEDNQN